MANGAMHEIMKQANVLNFDEKRTLAAWLLEQANQDIASARLNGRQQHQADEPDPFRHEEMQWLKEHREEYAGQYVALWRDQLVAHGTDWKSVLAEARAAGIARPLMAHIEAADELPFGGW